MLQTIQSSKLLPDVNSAVLWLQGIKHQIKLPWAVNHLIEITTKSKSWMVGIAGSRCSEGTLRTCHPFISLDSVSPAFAGSSGTCLPCGHKDGHGQLQSFKFVSDQPNNPSMKRTPPGHYCRGSPETSFYCPSFSHILLPSVVLSGGSDRPAWVMCSPQELEPMGTPPYQENKVIK